MTYELTADDIKNGVTLIPNADDDDGTIEKPWGVFRGGKCLRAKIGYRDFVISGSAAFYGDEVREKRLFKTADTGEYLERSCWVSGYTKWEYNSLWGVLNEQARADGYEILAFLGVVRAFSEEERENDFYELRTAAEKAAIDKRNKEARIDELKTLLAKEYDYKQFKYLRGEITEDGWTALKAEIGEIVAEINRLEEELAEA